MYRNNDICNIFCDKYYNEYIFLNTVIDLKIVNYFKNSFIVKKIIKKNDILVVNNCLFEKICIVGNYKMIKYICKKFNFNKNIIYFNSNDILYNIDDDKFIKKFIYYAIMNDNLKMLKFGIKINEKKFLLYLYNNIQSLPINNIKILKWIMKQDSLLQYY